MNQQQRKYALDRINAIFREKLRAFGKANPTPALTGQCQRDQILSGEALFKPSHYFGSTQRIQEVYAFVQPDPSLIEAHKEMTDAHTAEAEACKQAVSDSIMLGDNEQALEAIRSYEGS